MKLIIKSDVNGGGGGLLSSFPLFWVAQIAGDSVTSVTKNFR